MRFPTIRWQFYLLFLVVAAAATGCWRTKDPYRFNYEFSIDFQDLAPIVTGGKVTGEMLTDIVSVHCHQEGEACVVEFKEPNPIMVQWEKDMEEHKKKLEDFKKRERESKDAQDSSSPSPAFNEAPPEPPPKPNVPAKLNRQCVFRLSGEQLRGELLAAYDPKDPPPFALGKGYISIWEEQPVFCFEEKEEHKTKEMRGTYSDEPKGAFRVVKLEKDILRHGSTKKPAAKESGPYTYIHRALKKSSTNLIFTSKTTTDISPLTASMPYEQPIRYFGQKALLAFLPFGPDKYYFIGTRASFTKQKSKDPKKVKERPIGYGKLLYEGINESTGKKKKKK